MRWLLVLSGAVGLVSLAMLRPGDARRRFGLLDAKLDGDSILRRVEKLETRVDDLERRG